MQPFVDLLSISESELAALHPDWTKEEINDFRKEVESFEEDLASLRDEERDEEDDGKNSNFEIIDENKYTIFVWKSNFDI